MASLNNTEDFQHQRLSGSVNSGLKPVRPQLKSEWKPGMAAHWMEQTRRSKWVSIFRRVSYLLQFIATVAYLQYRARRTIGIFDRSQLAPYLTYQIFFFIMECVCAIPILIQLLQVWNVCRRNCIDFKQIPTELIKSYSASKSADQLESGPYTFPSVGVYIPCYNEEVSLVHRTVLGALRIDYPRHRLNVYLCDDGQDEEKQNMISKLKSRYPNVFYITRPEHNHAKAGNLNHALQHTECDLVVTLDADFIPRPHLVQRLMPYYYVWNAESGLYEFNERLAVVQTPQHFRNLSPHDSDPLDQRSLLFFDVIQPGKDWFNASTMVGTNNLISRAALQEADYYPYYSITEDTAMSLKFHSLGYRTYFVNESVATGPIRSERFKLDSTAAVSEHGTGQVDVVGVLIVRHGGRGAAGVWHHATGCAAPD
ncbi:CesA-like Cellulose synthase (UDP-forming) family GT2 [Gracilaria domingensis]|nr:CesA-like Cellulose synthase (UDP-forming) family GT2 [Gracilaria domingensis]